MLDMTSVEDFVNEYKISKGLIVMDKGFYHKNSIKTIKNMGLTYIIPLKQSSSKITNNDMNQNISSLLPGYKDQHIFYKKKELEDGSFLYSFRDPKGAYDQEIGYLSRTTKKGTYSEEKYLDKQSEFGLIVFESNADLDAQDIYAAYKERWDIEVVFKLYKDILDRDEVNVQGDYRLFATEFINFLSAILVCRTKKLLAETGLNKTYSYKQILRFLNKAHKIRYTRDGASLWKDNKRLKYIKTG